MRHLLHSDPTHADDEATSFGTFKPVGHVMIGMPDAPSATAMQAELRRLGWPREDVAAFSPPEVAQRMQALIARASPAAGFGSEITLMRRYVEESGRGTAWLLVRAEDDDARAQLAAVAQRHGARMAVSYRTLVVEHLVAGAQPAAVSACAGRRAPEGLLCRLYRRIKYLTLAAPRASAAYGHSGRNSTDARARVAASMAHWAS